MGDVAPGHAKAAGIVGIFVLLMALLNLICGIIWVTYGGSDASGIWPGILLLPTAILGIITWPKRSKGTLIGFLVLCIITIITSIVQCVIAGLAFLIWQILKAVIESKCTIKAGKCDCGSDKIPLELEDCSWISAIEAIWLCILIGNGLATIFVFAGSIIGCMGTCCAKTPTQTAVVMVEKQ
ncbi:hypothetical protein AC249_AIPGENE23616 [Exaiptasia diaphana]|nr:hypothetical protein AC249_AIPGENE23616 [Exaiptasia diaphana]